MHTKGPWRAKFVEYGGYDCMTDGWDISSDTNRIVTVDQGNYDQLLNKRPWRSVEAEANARLIAAAPELLAEAKELLANAKFSDGQSTVLTQDCEALEAAIAKAEGKISS